MLMNFILIYGSWCCKTMVWLGSDGIEPLIIGGFRRYHHAWCYWHYFSCNSGDLASTSSQIFDSWKLPMFLLRNGSLTLMNIASLMFLAILLSSLPTILKLSRDTSWPMVLWWSMMGDGAVICSLNLSPKVLPDSPIYSSSQSTLPHLYLYITPLFLSMVPLSLRCTSRSLMVLPPLKYTSTPCLLQMFFRFPLSLSCMAVQYRASWCCCSCCFCFLDCFSFVSCWC